MKKYPSTRHRSVKLKDGCNMPSVRGWLNVTVIPIQRKGYRIFYFFSPFKYHGSLIEIFFMKILNLAVRFKLMQFLISFLKEK